MVTSATAQLLSNMAMGALKSCSSGSPDTSPRRVSSSGNSMVVLWQAGKLHVSTYASFEVRNERQRATWLLQGLTANSYQHVVEVIDRC